MNHHAQSQNYNTGMHSASGEIMVKAKVRNASREDFLLINNEENAYKRIPLDPDSIKEKLSKIVTNSAVQRSRRISQNTTAILHESKEGSTK